MSAPTEEGKTIATRAIEKILGDDRPTNAHLGVIGVLTAIRAQMWDSNQDRQADRIEAVIDHIQDAADREKVLLEYLTSAEAQVEYAQNLYNDWTAERKSLEESYAGCRKALDKVVAERDYLQSNFNDYKKDYRRMRDSLDMVVVQRDEAFYKTLDQAETIAALERQVEQLDAKLAELEHEANLNDGNHDPVIIDNARAFLKFHEDRIADWGITPVELARQILEDAGTRTPSTDPIDFPYRTFDEPEPCDECITPDEEARLAGYYTKEQVRQVALELYRWGTEHSWHPDFQAGRLDQAIDRFIADLN